jgi:hypothetical protein
VEKDGRTAEAVPRRGRPASERRQRQFCMEAGERERGRERERERERESYN